MFKDLHLSDQMIIDIIFKSQNFTMTMIKILLYFVYFLNN